MATSRKPEPDVVLGPVPDVLRRAVEELGLAPYEARVLLALFRLGSANSIQLAKVSGVPRTAVYPVLDQLGGKGLAVRLPNEGPAQWTSPGREEVLRRLDADLAAAMEDRLVEHRAQAAKVRELLEKSFPETPSVALPFVHQLQGAQRVREAYDRLLAGADREVLMFTRPPFAYRSGRDNVNPAVLELCARKVACRVLYQREQVEGEAFAGFREEMETYHEAGVQARVVDELAIKLVVVDASATLVGMNDPVAPEVGYPTTLLIEHPGYARIQALAFAQLWPDAVPYEEARRSAGPDRGEARTP